MLTFLIFNSILSSIAKYDKTFNKAEHYENLNTNYMKIFGKQKES